MPQLSSLKSMNIKIDPTLSKSDTMETTEEFPSAIGLMNVRQVICILGMMIGKTKISLRLAESKIQMHRHSFPSP